LTVFADLQYEEDGLLVDATGHRWRRRRDWLEPAEATALVEQGTPLLVQLCRAGPRPERRERFKRDIASRLMTGTEVEAAHERSTVPTIMNPELWDGTGSEPTVVLLFEAGPGPRGLNELINDWA
jgi:hypothetical protein